MQNIRAACPHCGSKKIENNYCKDCKKEAKKKKPLRWLVLFLLFLIFAGSYPLIENLGFYIPVKRTTLVEIPYSLTKEVNASIPRERFACINRSFRFTTLTGNVDTYWQNVRPNLIINNLENEWGFFKVNFSYIEEDKFPYDIYGGKNLSENLRTGKISYEDAAFYSENYEYLIGPAESVEIRNITPKKDRSKQYWAIANIIEPKKTECSTLTEYITRLENKTFTEMRPEKKIIYVKEYRKISELIVISSFSEWIILIILAFIIIFLLIKIFMRLKEFRKTD